MGLKPMAIQWTVAAEGGLDRLLCYIETENAVAAHKLWARIIAAIQAASEFPQLAPHLPELGPTYRQILNVRPFRVIYRADGEVLWVIAVLRQEQDFDPSRFTAEG